MPLEIFDGNGWVPYQEKSIVELLSDPFLPCVISSTGIDDIAAVNRANSQYDGFVSYAWDCSAGLNHAYVLEYMVDKGTLHKVPVQWMPKPIDTDTVMCQNGARKLRILKNSPAREIELAGVKIREATIGEIIALAEKRSEAVEAIAEKIREFYGG